MSGATKKKPDPTPEEIKQLAAEIRAGWNEGQRASRLVQQPPPPYVVPHVATYGGGMVPMPKPTKE